MSVYSSFDDFRAIGLRMGMREVALQDAWDLRFNTYDGSMTEFFTAMKTEAPHYFAAPVENSVEHAAFYSLGAQAAYCREHGEAATRDLLATEGLRLGQIKPAVKIAFDKDNNPYDRVTYRGSEAGRQKAIADLIKSKPSLSADLAHKAGRTIDDLPLRPVGAAAMKR
jgi:hypothetical protein